MLEWKQGIYIGRKEEHPITYDEGTTTKIFYSFFAIPQGIENEIATTTCFYVS